MNNYLYLNHNDEQNSKTCIDMRDVAYFDSKIEGGVFFVFKNGYQLKVNCNVELKKQINTFLQKWIEDNFSLENKINSVSKREKISTEEAVAISLIASTPDWEREELKKELFPDENNISPGAVKILQELGVKNESVSEN